jgi:serine/threonine protein kinase
MRDLVGKRLGDFEIVHELGRGGMGIVYEARQVSLNRRVALKVLSGGLGLTAKAVQRFRREAEAAARLHHTNIVPVYATGEADGIHFYAMELIAGPSLDQVLRQLRQATQQRSATEPASAAVAKDSSSLDLEATGPYVPEASSLPSLSASSLSSDSHYFDTVARMIAEVADALDYAHQEGVIHRDLKPSNLLLAPTGRLSLNDFGLARMLEQPGMTMSGEFVGTPSYMSPEQITAGRIPLDHRTDIYSLGATLYELLTLQPPHQGQSREQVLAQIAHKEPRAPRRLRKQVPLDLETICLKCLEKDPDRRYQTAGQLAEDLRRYVNRFAISARRAGPVQRLVKWARRQPGLAAGLACAVLAVGIALAFAYRAQHEKQQRLVEQEQARVQLLDEKIRNAYLVAGSGDLEKTDEAIKEIEILGGSTGQVRLLRGMVACHRGDTQASIKELEQAVKLLPRSVAARALLAAAYDGFGQNEKSEQILEEISRLTPTSAEDYLFKGYATETIETGRGLPDLNEGLRQRDSPLGRAMRATARANRAIDTANLQDVEEALADANTARGMAPDNPLVLSASVNARTTAAYLYQEAGLLEKRTAVVQEAARDVQALEPFLDFPRPAWDAYDFCRAIGASDKALAIARRSLERTGAPSAALNCLFVLYQQGKFQEALDCLNLRRESDLAGDTMRAFVLAELPPDGPRQALQEYEQLARKYPGGHGQMMCARVLLFLGKKEQARQALQGIRLVADHLSPDGRTFAEALLQFRCGRLPEERLLAEASTSRFKRIQAHYTIGFDRLAEGDRAGAREHIQKAVGTHDFWEQIYFYSSQMFLNRLDKDPTWPPWIPVKP